jgi:hypothetical protein
MLCEAVFFLYFVFFFYLNIWQKSYIKLNVKKVTLQQVQYVMILVFWVLFLYVVTNVFEEYITYSLLRRAQLKSSLLWELKISDTLFLFLVGAGYFPSQPLPDPF